MSIPERRKTGSLMAKRTRFHYVGMSVVILAAVFWLIINYLLVQRSENSPVQLSVSVSNTTLKRFILENGDSSPRIPNQLMSHQFISQHVQKPKKTIPRVSTFDTALERKTSKIILMWSSEARFVDADGILTYSQCPVKSCLFTSDTSLLEQSDVVIIYMDHAIDLPVNRLTHQRFVFFHLESPPNTTPERINDPLLRYGYFNWTMTYRWDSDIVQREHYNYLIAKSMTNDTKEIRPRILQDWSLLDGIEPLSNTEKKLSDPVLIKLIRGKTKMVAWFVSHCTTPIRREEYVRQLSQYVDVDIFGKCTNKSCPFDCDQMLRTDYKFYLSFENSWCQDYVSEKFYRPLLDDTVPIVLGGADYNLFAPSHSYINARDFGSPKELADYLLLLNKTENLYAKYFEWKRQYEVLSPDNYGMCDLCTMAHDDSLPAKVYPDIKEWWFQKEGLPVCEHSSTNYF